MTLFLLHQRSEVLARCKVQVHRDRFAVILVIGGEYVRITRCTHRERGVVDRRCMEGRTSGPAVAPRCPSYFNGVAFTSR